MEAKTFDYRFVRTSYSEYSLYEVYYDRYGCICAWSKHPVQIGCSSLKEVREDIKHIKRASRKTYLVCYKDHYGNVEALMDSQRYMPRGY